MIADVVVVIIVLVNLIIGFKKGFLRCLLGIATTLVSAIVCVFLAKPTASMLDNLFDLSPKFQEWMNGFLGANTGWYALLLISAVGLFILLRLILIIVDNAVMHIKETMPAVNFFDQALGLFFGLILSVIYLTGLVMSVEFLAGIPFLADITKWLQVDGESGSIIAYPIYDFIKTEITPKVIDLLGWATSSTINNLA
jgi:uncharacterized membrane protein required for colicin V production